MKNIFLSAFTSIFLAGISLNAVAQEASVEVEKAAADSAAESLLSGSASVPPAIPAPTTNEVKPAEVAAPNVNEAPQMPEVSLPETASAPAATPPSAPSAPEAKAEAPAEPKAEVAEKAPAKPEEAKKAASVKAEMKKEKKVEAKQAKKAAAVKKSSPTTETLSVPATPPKSFSKVTDFNTVVVSGGTPSSATVWRPAAQATRVQEISAPNLTIENDDYSDSFLSKLKIPDPRAKAQASASVAREAASEGNKIEIERNSFKDLFAGAAEAAQKTQPKTVEVDYSGAILSGEPVQNGATDANSAQTAALTTGEDKFNPLDGLAEQDNVDASEVQEIEVESLNYDAAQPKNFYMRDLGMKVEVKNAAKADVKVMKDAYDALQFGQIETAIEFYKKATAENPGDTKAMFGLATAYHMAGQRSEAKATYKKIINENPNYSQAVNNYIVLVGEEGGDGAINELRGLMQKNPNYALIPAQMGSIYFKKLDMKQAAEYYSMAVALDPANNNYKYNLARIFDKMGAYERARSLYGELIDDAFKGGVIPVDVDDLRDRYMEISKG
jgi:tetratricopeptide (TPR) repeat protein